MVETSVCVGAGRVAVWVTESGIGEDRFLFPDGDGPVGDKRSGWNGVGVADGFGATVTKAKGGGCEFADADVPHPARRRLAMMTIHKTDLMVIAVGVKCSKLSALGGLRLLGSAWKSQLEVPGLVPQLWELGVRCWKLLENWG